MVTHATLKYFCVQYTMMTKDMNTYVMGLRYYTFFLVRRQYLNVFKDGPRAETVTYLPKTIFLYINIIEIMRHRFASCDAIEM